VRRVGEIATDLEVRVGNMLLGKSDLTKKIPTNRGAFEVRIPDPLTKQQIIVDVARTLGVPLDHVPVPDYIYTSAMCTLPKVLVSWPEWWEGVHVCYDQDLLLELYSQYREFEENFRRSLRPGGLEKDGTTVRDGVVDHGQVEGSPDGRKVPPTIPGAKSAPADDGGDASD